MRTSRTVILVCLLEVTIVSSIYITREKEKKSHDLSSSSSLEDRSHEHDNHTHHRPRHRKRCPPEWTTFDRPQGRWCVRIFYGDAITHDNAEAACKLYHARLTGLQNAKEKSKIAELSKQLSNELYLPPKSISVRLGGVRKPECLANIVCAAKDTFMWTDKFTTGTGGFIFPIGAPNGGIGSYVAKLVGPQNCLQQIISPDLFYFGDLDDVRCNELLKLYACGKRP